MKDYDLKMASTERHIYTVSELTSSIKLLLENEFPFVWISGEISNFRMPSSGHFYFTLKDDKAQISSVMFRNQTKSLNFELEDGQHVIGLGRISLYEPRGSYQIILEFIEPKGVGALQIAFEQLKKKLQEEGLFDQKYKNPIPFVPQKISLITSPTGSVVHDILNVVGRRFPNMSIDIVPVKVQGQSAILEIIQAFELINQRMTSDVIILARGGGSLEDLLPFNSEDVARAIFNSQIPVISAIGHETDYTISDFVADLRAPTPSAAAELAVPVKQELINALNSLGIRLERNIRNWIKQKYSVIAQTTKRLPHPKNKIQDLILRVDDYSLRLAQSFRRTLRYKKQLTENKTNMLIRNNPIISSYKLNAELDKYTYKLNNILEILIREKKHLLREHTHKLVALDPTAILKRGYSIARSLPEYLVVRSTDDVFIDQQIEVTVASGNLICRVERISKHGQKNI